MQAFPRRCRPTCGRNSLGRAAAGSSIAFVSQASLEQGVSSGYGLYKSLEPVRHCRVRKANMKLNDATPRIEVDPELYEVRADGVALKCEPAAVLPLAQRCSLF
jgi:urease alpha subunit